jgi:hypothetical protein
LKLELLKKNTLSQFIYFFKEVKLKLKIDEKRGAGTLNALYKVFNEK